MATAPRTRPPAGTRPRGASPNLTALLVLDALRNWVIPTVAGVTIVACAALGATGLVAEGPALSTAIFAALILLLYVGMRPLLAPDQPRRDVLLGATLGLVWLVLCYVPFYTRIFPGTALVNAVEIDAAGTGLPLHIPAAGHSTLDLVLEGHLAPNPTGGASPAIHYRMDVEDAGGAHQTLEGQFDDTLKTQRLGRRGTATVHQSHASELRVISNPGGGDLTVTRLTLEPENSPPVNLSAYAHPLPGLVVLALGVLALLTAVVAFDRLGGGAETDGSLTLATTAVIGAAVVFWTSNVVHPDFRTLVGSAIFGGPVGFAAGALVWWVAKKLIARPAR
jgi:hypothetical protein